MRYNTIAISLFFLWALVYLIMHIQNVVERVNIVMATTKSRTSSFSRNLTAVPSSTNPGLKYGPNGTIFMSSGIPDLDSNSLHLLLSWN